MASLKKYLMLLLWVSLCTACPAGEEAQPDGLHWDLTTIEVAVQPGQAEAEAWFTFSNPSGQAISILKVESDCDCLVSQLDRSRYYPGEDGLLLATLQVKEAGTETVRWITVRTRTASGREQATRLCFIIRTLD